MYLRCTSPRNVHTTCLCTYAFSYPSPFQHTLHYFAFLFHIWCAHLHFLLHSQSITHSTTPLHTQYRIFCSSPPSPLRTATSRRAISAAIFYGSRFRAVPWPFSRFLETARHGPWATTRTFPFSIAHLHSPLHPLHWGSISTICWQHTLGQRNKTLLFSQLHAPLQDRTLLLLADRTLMQLEGRTAD